MWGWYVAKSPYFEGSGPNASAIGNGADDMTRITISQAAKRGFAYNPTLYRAIAEAADE